MLKEHQLTFSDIQSIKVLNTSSLHERYVYTIAFPYFLLFFNFSLYNLSQYQGFLKANMDHIYEYGHSWKATPTYDQQSKASSKDNIGQKGKRIPKHPDHTYHGSMTAIKKALP